MNKLKVITLFFNVLRELFIGFEITIVYFKFFLAAFLFYQWKKQHRTRYGADLLLTMTLVLIYLAISRIMYMYNDYYYYPVEFNFEDTLIKRIAKVIQLASYTLTIFSIEKMFISNRRYYFTIFSSFFLGLNFINIYLGFQIVLTLNVISDITQAIFLGYFFYLLSSKTHGNIRINMIMILIGLVVYIVGSMGTSWAAIQIFGYSVRLYADFFKIGGITIWIVGFYNLPIFGEFDWKEKLKEIYVIYTDGRLLYNYKFTTGLSKADSDLVAGGVIGIEAILSEITASKQTLQIIDHRDIKIIFEYGQFAISALICEEELQTIPIKLREFTKEFEEFFKNILPLWNGDQSIFQPTQTLIEKHFI